MTLRTALKRTPHAWAMGIVPWDCPCAFVTTFPRTHAARATSTGQAAPRVTFAPSASGLLRDVSMSTCACMSIWEWTCDNAMDLPVSM